MADAFTEGAKVILTLGRRFEVHTIAKVYKSGRFVLSDDKTKQQWRVYPDRKSARPTGGLGYSRRTIYAYDDALLARLETAMRRYDRTTKIRTLVGRITADIISDATLDAFETALEKYQEDRRAHGFGGSHED